MLGNATFSYKLPWMRRKTVPKVAAIDLFCGAGGLTRGLMDAGIRVVAGYDVDDTCRFPYEHNNPKAKFVKKSVIDITGRELRRKYPAGHIRVLVGCAPCQTFSKYTQGLENEHDPKWTLLREFGRLVRELRPDIVSMENVPDLRRYSVFDEFLTTLADEGFFFGTDPDAMVVNCPDYGVPQDRRRLVLMASRFGPVSFDEPTHRPSNYLTVSSVLRRLPPLNAGEVYKRDPLHRASRLSDTNLKRIRASRPGGSWREWPVSLRAKCHREESGNSYPSVYGRMEWSKPAPTITTEFFGYGSGRFGHPEQDRGLSLREGALLQSFPRKYQFVAPGAECNFKAVGRMIGNAVPVQLGAAIGRTIKGHLLEYVE